MSEKSIGSARMEPTEDTTVRIFIERANGKSTVLYLEPGNGITITDDGPIQVEAFAMEKE